MLLGAEVLFGNILRLGVPGLLVAWLVTPVVIVFMYQFGVRFLQIGSRSLVMVIAAATSVCGVSAAIAVAAAARARKQELTLAVGMSLDLHRGDDDPHAPGHPLEPAWTRWSGRPG